MTKPNAEDQYAVGHATALGLLDTLQQAIENMPNPESINGNWGYAGTMEEINSQLRNLLSFTTGEY
jgi:hypothetical protein